MLVPAGDLDSLGDELRRDLARPKPRSVGFAAGHAYARVAPADNDLGDVHRWVVGYSPRVTTVGVGLATELLMRCLAHVADCGGGEVTLWRANATADDDRAARAAGLDVDRDLHQMSVPLPLHEVASFPDGVTVRTFVPDRDDDAWLVLNNAAFAGHVEQGGWTRETLAARRREPWFDPTWFLLAVEQDPGSGSERLIGFNWLRHHPASGNERAIGEIYAIGVAPDQQGRGLGRALAVEGLRRVATRGTDTGMLYVAATNSAAVALYRALGFTITRTDRAYTAMVIPA